GRVARWTDLAVRAGPAERLLHERAADPPAAARGSPSVAVRRLRGRARGALGRSLDRRDPASLRMAPAARNRLCAGPDARRGWPAHRGGERICLEPRQRIPARDGGRGRSGRVGQHAHCARFRPVRKPRQPTTGKIPDEGGAGVAPRWRAAQHAADPRRSATALTRAWPPSRPRRPRGSTMIELGVNIDHVATVRQARRTYEPDPVWAAVEAH